MVRPFFVNALLALLTGFAGGAAFHLLDLPLPWTLGAMSAAALAAVTGRGWLMPGPARDLARPVVGVIAGSAFTPLVVASLPQWWPAILTVASYTLATTLLGWVFFARICRFDRTTAFFASAPGGLSELTLLGSSLGGDIRTLVLVHSMRVVIVVFTVPFILELLTARSLDGQTAVMQAKDTAGMLDWAILAACGVAGYAIGRAWAIPGGVMIPALVLSAVAHGTGLTAAGAPGWLVALVQVVIGSAAGARFVGIGWREVWLTLLGGFGWALFLVAAAVALAFAGTTFLDRPVPALTLAFSPGGMAEMTVIAFAIGTEVAFVVTCQVCRIVFIYFASPLLFKAAGGGGAAGTGRPPAAAG